MYRESRSQRLAWVHFPVCFKITIGVKRFGIHEGGIVNAPSYLRSSTTLHFPVTFYDEFHLQTDTTLIPRLDKQTNMTWGESILPLLLTSLLVSAALTDNGRTIKGDCFKHAKNDCRLVGQLKMSKPDFWVVSPCKLVGRNRRLKGTYCLYLHGRRWNVWALMNDIWQIY